MYGNVRVEILRIVDDSFPVFVEFELIDCKGNSYHFIDKTPVVGCEYDVVPKSDGYLRCSIIDEREDTYVIDTSLPDDIENVNGECRFEVKKEQMLIKK